MTLGEAAWALALYCGSGDAFELPDGTPVDIRGALAVVAEGARQVTRAKMLRDVSVAVCERRTAERDTALARLAKARDDNARDAGLELLDRIALLEDLLMEEKWKIRGYE